MALYTALECWKMSVLRGSMKIAVRAQDAGSIRTDQKSIRELTCLFNFFLHQRRPDLAHEFGRRNRFYQHCVRAGVNDVHCKQAVRL